MRVTLCSFCGKSQTEVTKLIQGPGVYICDNCVAVCKRVLEREMGPRPTRGNGKICYVEIPANDINRSAEFHGRTFGWRIRQRTDGTTAFDDPVDQVSGTWVLGRSPATVPGFIIYVMVCSVSAVIRAVVANGGEVEAVSADGPVITARIRDPAGNILGLYQEPEPPPAAMP